MEFGKTMQLALLLCFVLGSLCMPSKRLFIDVDCDKPVICPKKAMPMCCTDGKTYTNQCALDMENQKRICHEGQFNPIAKVHDGPCTSATAAP